MTVLDLAAPVKPLRDDYGFFDFSSSGTVALDATNDLLATVSRRLLGGTLGRESAYDRALLAQWRTDVQEATT